MKQNQIISSDAQAVNFREICMGSITPNTLYRSSHPIKDNCQEKSIALLAANVKITTVLNLHDTPSGILKKAPIAPWYDKLVKNKRVIALDMDFKHYSDDFRKKLKKDCVLLSKPNPLGSFIATPELTAPVLFPWFWKLLWA